MKLTSTNSSIGLIVTVMKVETGCFYNYDEFVSSYWDHLLFKNCKARRPGDYGADVPPDPIPNSNVKLCCADGTAS